ncbi:MAG: hypothetical protein J2P50_04295 [Hyphomicrobiaceae bacterium]|nr:hypothetical protein [Hyphomicrobiaceae bacterium]
MSSLLIVLAAVGGTTVRAQEMPAEIEQREEIIDAIIAYATSGGCETRRKVFGGAFDATCGYPDPGPDPGSERMAMWTLLDGLSEHDLMALCRRHGIADCEKPREVSNGRAVLTFESSFDIEFSSNHATWSPDGRLLLLDNLNLPAAEVRLLDVAAGRLLDPPLYAGVIHDAAWSPDGAYIALSDRKRAHPGQPPPVGAVRLFASSTRKERARISAGDAGCTLGVLEGMAFTADSKALWVLCSQADKTAQATRLRVPTLEAEDSFAPASPSPALSEIYWEEGVVRSADDLIVTARFRSPKPIGRLRPLVQSYSLRTRRTLSAPIPATAGAARLAPDLTSFYIGNELWSARTGEHVATGVDRSGRYLGAPNRIPQLGMYVEAKPLAKPQLSMLAVLDSATGATVQELGPVPRPLTVLVAPNGTKVAVSNFHAVRFYRVNP